MSLALYGMVEKLQERVKALECTKADELLDLVRENNALRNRIASIEESLGMSVVDATDKRKVAKRG